MSYSIALTVLVALCVKTSECLQCFSCSDISDPTVCNSLRNCTAGQSCFLETHPSNSRIVYSMGCRDVQVCDARYHAIIGRSTKKRQTATCHECCSADNCNMNLCPSIKEHGESESFLLFINGHALYQMDIATHTVHELMLRSGNPVKGFDYDPVMKTVYWYDTGDSAIYSNLLNSDLWSKEQRSRTEFISVITSYDGIAIDPIARLMFFSTSSRIKVASLDNGKIATVIATDISLPHALALDCKERKIYWTDSLKQTIEVSDYNGSNRRTVINSGLQKPMALAFDVTHKELYWVNTGFNIVEKAKVDGTGRQTVPRITGNYSSGLAVLDNDLYYASLNNPFLIKTSLSGGIPSPFGKPDFSQLYDVKAYNISNINLGRTACSNKNGGCSDVCLPTSVSGVQCICPLGVELLANGTCVPSTIVRLAGPNSTPWQGRVELSYDNGATWNTICSGLRANDANVICGMLGWERLDASAVLNGVYGSAQSSLGTLYGPSCTGAENSIIDCPNFLQHIGCLHDNDMGVNCSREGKVRLKGSGAIDQGRVEILMNQQWGTICDDNFGPAEAGVACAMLGFSRIGAEILRNSEYAIVSFPTPIHLDNVACNGNEQTLLECKHNKVTDLTDCIHSEDVSIRCQPATSARIRLIGSNATSSQGTVEISSNGGLTWATVCDDNFNDAVAQVVCHMLGFNRLGASARRDAYFGQGNGSAESLTVMCNGQETSLFHCKFTNHRKCSHRDDAGVICPYTTTEKLRLANGPTANQGRVEVSYDNGTTWGTVCSDYSIDTNVAGVVCAALGYPRDGATDMGYNMYDRQSSNQPVFLKNPTCDGTETALSDCASTSTCRSSNYYDIGVMCLAENTTVVRLANNAKFSGRVEVSVDNGRTWGTICNDYFGSHDAAVVCRMLGFNSTEAVAITNGTYGAGYVSQPILFDDLNCTGNESSILHCKSNPIGESDCSHNEDVGVSCVGRGDIGYIGDIHLRLAGSNSNSTQGRVEIRIGKQNTWGTICDDSFDDNEAAVICSMLGFQRTDARAQVSAYFGSGDSSQQILLDDLTCLGTEDSILDCGHPLVGINNCGHSEDAGVICKP